MAKRYWVEITDPNPHGGPGWEYGQWLWSPTKDKKGKKIYEIMKQVNIDDVVVHFARDKNGKMYVDGESQVADKVVVVSTPPPQPGNWAGRSDYYKIKLKNFTKYTGTKRREVKSFIVQNSNLIANESTKIQKFYPVDKNNKLNQGKYLCEITALVYKAI